MLWSHLLETKHHSVTRTVVEQNWIKIFSQLLFYLFFPLSPWPVPQSGHSICCDELRGHSAPSSRQMFYDSLFLQRPQHSTVTIWGVQALFNTAASFDTSKGAGALHRDAVWEWRAECAHLGTRGGSAHQSGVVFPRLELLPRYSYRHAGKCSVLTVWTSRGRRQLRPGLSFKPSSTIGYGWI